MQTLIQKLLDIENKCFTSDKITERSFKRFLRTKALIITAQSYAYIISTYTKHKARIYSIAVIPEYRGKGIARALIERAIEEARALGKEYITLEAKEDLRTFYEKLGFEEYGRKENYYEDGSDAVKFRKRI